MTIPHTVRVAGLVLAATGFYTYVGKMVPQKEVLPPQETVIRSDLTTADMVKVGREVMDSKGLCFTCHTIGRTGALRFPDLDGVGDRAKTRVAGLSDVEYFAQTRFINQFRTVYRQLAAHERVEVPETAPGPGRRHPGSGRVPMKETGLPSSGFRRVVERRLARSRRAGATGTPPWPRPARSPTRRSATASAWSGGRS